MPNWEFEDMALENAMVMSSHNNFVCGIDEVGRGSLAGPVVACALVFKTRDLDFLHQINDSKKLTKNAREYLLQLLQLNTYYCLGSCSNLEIDQFNIYHASLLAMKRAYYGLCELCIPTAVLIDGTANLNLPTKSYPIVKGDSKSLTIAAASIVAKVYRDRLMQKLSLEEHNSCYGWENNAGYATKKHKAAIEQHGISKYHRTTFAPIKFSSTKI